jgi:hypothetical protein
VDRVSLAELGSPLDRPSRAQVLRARVTRGPLSPDDSLHVVAINYSSVHDYEVSPGRWSAPEMPVIGDTCALLLDDNGDAWMLGGGLASPPAPVDQWHAPVLAAGMTNYGGSYAPAGYRKVGDLVCLRGLVTIQSPATTNYAMFTLPAGYLPGYVLVFTVSLSGALARIDVDIDGRVIYNSGGTLGAGSYLNLDQVRFPSEF